MGLKGLFEISKLLFQYSPEKNRDLRQFSNTPILQRDESAKLLGEILLDRTDNKDKDNKLLLKSIKSELIQVEW